LARATALGGGVSSIVLLVEAGSYRVVVKRPRSRLLVPDEWLANPERAFIEAAALSLAGATTPAAVPVLLDLDAESCTVTMTAAPASWRSWKELLLEDVVDPSVAQRLGTLLGTWHRVSAQDRAKLTGLTDIEVFTQLRIDPFYRTIATRHPDVADQVALATGSLIDGSHSCFVHGDFSPKNVLVGDDGLWVIDFEVAHAGNPVFDLAFLIAHLFLKSVHRPLTTESYRRCAAQFLESYRDAAGATLVPADESLGLQVGCLVLARVDGKSQAEYLTTTEREHAWRIGVRLLREPVHPLSVWPSSDGCEPL
jgi:5-methylthioribose kinase